MQGGSVLDGRHRCCPPDAAIDSCGICYGDSRSCAKLVYLLVAVVANETEAQSTASWVAANIRSMLHMGVAASYTPIAISVLPSGGEYNSTMYDAGPAPGNITFEVRSLLGLHMPL